MMAYRRAKEEIDMVKNVSISKPSCNTFKIILFKMSPLSPG